MRLPPAHLALVLFIAGGIFIGGVLYPRWRAAVDQNRDARADPHHIAGNLYFVGTPDLTSFLLVGPAGHILIGGGDPRAARKIIDNVEQLGFALADIRALLATDPHADEAGGFAALQDATGAELWATDANASVLATGGRNDPSIVYTPYRLLARAGVLDYPAPRVDHRVSDDETVRIGPLAVTAHITPGHAPGCTTWTFLVRDAGRDLHVVHRCSLAVPYGASLVDPEQPANVREDFERTFSTLRRLPIDIWLTSHGRDYGRFRKYQESLRLEAAGGAEGDPAAAFIDPDGYVTALDAAEAAFRAVLAAQQAK